MRPHSGYDFSVRLPLERRSGQRALYVLVDPRTDALRYVGQTPDPKKRLAAHLGTRKTARGDIGPWLVDLVGAGYAPVMRVFAYAPEQDYRLAERAAIVQACAEGHDLLNVDGFGRKHSRRRPKTAEERARIGEIQRARYERERAQGIKRTRTPEQRARIAEATKAAMPAALTPQARAAHAAAHASEQARAKMSARKRGHKQSPEWVAKRVATRAARPDYHELQSRASTARWEKHRAREALQAPGQET